MADHGQRFDGSIALPALHRQAFFRIRGLAPIRSQRVAGRRHDDVARGPLQSNASPSDCRRRRRDGAIRRIRTMIVASSELG